MVHAKSILNKPFMRKTIEKNSDADTDTNFPVKAKQEHFEDNNK